jgi:hypothetical protein
VKGDFKIAIGLLFAGEKSVSAPVPRPSGPSSKGTISLHQAARSASARQSCRASSALADVPARADLSNRQRFLVRDHVARADQHPIVIPHRDLAQIGEGDVHQITQHLLFGERQQRRFWRPVQCGRRRSRRRLELSGLELQLQERQLHERISGEARRVIDFSHIAPPRKSGGLFFGRCYFC